MGDCGCCDDSRGPEHFDARLDARRALHPFDFVGGRLIIGKFLAIAQAVQFIMNGASHPMGGFSTFPFAAMGFVPGEAFSGDADAPRGDAVIGHDVWIARLRAIRWWDRPVGKVMRHIAALRGIGLDALEAAARQGGCP